MLWHKTQGAGFGAAVSTAIEDVFSTYLYTGNSSTQTITNGIDLAGEGGLVWLKTRSSVTNHALFDTERGVSNKLSSDTAGAASTSFTGVSAFNSDGFSLGSIYNTSPVNYASWTFRKAPRFFDVVTYTGDGTAGRTVSHNLGCEVGFMVVKKTNSSGDWPVQHRSLGAQGSGNIRLNSTDAAIANGQHYWGDGIVGINPTSSVFTVDNHTWVNTLGDTYVAYLFAHDPLGPSGDGSDGLIACGSYTGNGSSNGPEIDLGWEPQWLLTKRTNSSADWQLVDVMRGMSSAYYRLFPNTSVAEDFESDGVIPTATGFKLTGVQPTHNASGGTYIYIAIRRGPMREPTVGTEVFAIDANNSVKPGYTSNFPVDMAFYKNASGGESVTSARLIQGKDLKFNTADAEGGNINATFDFMDGWNGYTGGVSSLYSWMFRRAPGFFDVVAYTGNSSTTWYDHNLGVVPELIAVKCRSGSEDWSVYSKNRTGTNKILVLNSSSAEQTVLSPFDFPSTPTETQFRLGTNSRVNSSGNTYIAYLFATLPGVSKVGSYTGNGSSQTINCGFTTGARFILIKRTNSTGDWYVWDTARGIVAGNDPHLSLNTTAAEVTTNDSIDPDSSGFIVNQVAATNINVSSASYIYLAIA